MLQSLKKVLAPIDFSEFSIEAMRTAYRLAKDAKAELHLLHVVAPHYTILERTREMAREAGLVEEAEQELARIKKDYLENSSKVQTAVVVGAAASRIAEYALRQKFDLIVLSKHGSSDIGHMLIGSVAERLVRSAPCDVLVVKV